MSDQTGDQQDLQPGLRQEASGLLGRLSQSEREALLVKIQEMVRDRVMQVPVYEYPIFYGVGPRVEVSGVGLIKGWVYPAPFEDLKLKSP